MTPENVNFHCLDGYDDPETWPPVFGRCPLCGGREATDLGSLGRLHWVRCRSCGATLSRPRDDPEGTEVGA